MWSELEILCCGFNFSKCDRSGKTFILNLSLWQIKYISLVRKKVYFSELLFVQDQNLLCATHLFVVLNLKLLILSYHMGIRLFCQVFFLGVFQLLSSIFFFSKLDNAESYTKSRKQFSTFQKDYFCLGGKGRLHL